jgi:ribosomal protein S18 acetylase RimI-like enzyme
MIRDLRKSDAPRVLALLKTQFPEEERIMGTRPEGFAEVVARAFRWDAQFFIGMARLFGRPVFRFFVFEEDGQLVATTLLSFPERSGYVSMVVVDPAYRRRGHAQALLERSRATAQSARRKYIALDVLAQNAPARALYERIGYQPLRETSFMVRESGASIAGATSSHVRPFRKRDARPLVEVARRSTPTQVQEVLPLRESSLRAGGVANRILLSQSASWVVDRGRGPEAYVGAVSTRTTAAAHMTDPIVGEGVDAVDAAALVRTAVDWCSAHGAPKIVAQVPVDNVRGRAALQGGGFHDALALWTLYRPVA